MYSLTKCFDIFRNKEGKPGGLYTRNIGCFKHNKARDMFKSGVIADKSIILDNDLVDRAVMTEVIKSLFDGPRSKNKIRPYFPNDISYYVDLCSMGLKDPNLVPKLAKKRTTNPEVIEPGWATSRQIADILGNDHKNILAAIRNFETRPEWGRLNIRPTTYSDTQGKTQPQFVMSQKGFFWLMTELRNAGEWKEAIIDDYADARAARGRTMAEQNLIHAQMMVAQERKMQALQGEMEVLQSNINDLNNSFMPTINQEGVPDGCIPAGKLCRSGPFFGINEDKLALVAKLYKYPTQSYINAWTDPNGVKRSKIEHAFVETTDLGHKLWRDLIGPATYSHTAKENHIFMHPKKEIGKFYVRIGLNSIIESMIARATCEPTTSTQAPHGS